MIFINKILKMAIYCLLLSNNYVFCSNISSLIQHVTHSIEQAEKLSSKLTADVLNIQGFSSPRIKHLLNNLCSLSNNKYLEVGVWNGSTFVSALYENQSTNNYALAIDNWSEFNGHNPKIVFQRNITNFLRGIAINFFEKDAFLVDLQKISQKINIFFYDGDHSTESQKKAFTYYNPIFEDVFIAVVDDYNWEQVQVGTQAAFKELNYDILFEKHLISPGNSSSDSWWNGLYVAVVSKTK